MNRRFVHHLMVALIAVQGGGLLDDLHQMVAHGGRGRHACHTCERGHAQEEPGRRESLEAGAEHRANHAHDPATCSICQTLAALKAVGTSVPAAEAVTPAPTDLTTPAEGIPLARIHPPSLSPRAPPKAA